MSCSITAEELEKVILKGKAHPKQKGGLGRDILNKIDKINDKKDFDFSFILKDEIQEDSNFFLYLINRIIKINPVKLSKQFKKVAFEHIFKVEAKLGFESLQTITLDFNDFTELNKNKLLQFFLFRYFIGPENRTEFFFSIMNKLMTKFCFDKYQREIIAEYSVLINLCQNNKTDRQFNNTSLIKDYVKSSFPKKYSTLRIIIGYILLNLSIEGPEIIYYIAENYLHHFTRTINDLICIQVQGNKSKNDNFFQFTKVLDFFFFEENKLLSESSLKSFTLCVGEYKKMIDQANNNSISYNNIGVILRTLIFILTNLSEKEELNFTPNLILKNFKTLINNTQEFTGEILTYIKSIVNKKGGKLRFEWETICEILLIAVKGPKKNIAYIETILELIDSLNTFYEFNGNIREVAQILKEIQKLNKDNLVIFKIRLLLETYESFIENFDNLIKNIIENYQEDNCRILCFLFQTIKYNYIFSSQIHTEETSQNINKLTVIEKTLEENCEKFLKIFGASLILYKYYAYMLSEILQATKKLTFFEKIIKIIISIDLPKEHNFFVEVFSITLTKLNNTFQKEKLLILKSLIFSKKKLRGNEKLQTICINVIKNSIINKDYEIQFSHFSDEASLVPLFPSQMILNFDSSYQKDKKAKEKLYQPYLPFNNRKLFYFFLERLSEKSEMTEKIYEYFSFCFDNFIFLKSINYDKLISEIVNNREKEYLSDLKGNIFVLKMKIYLNLSYQLNSNIIEKDSKLNYNAFLPLTCSDSCEIKQKVIIHCIGIWSEIVFAKEVYQKNIFSNLLLVMRVVKFLGVSFIEDFNMKTNDPLATYSISKINLKMKKYGFSQNFQLTKLAVNLLLQNLSLIKYKTSYSFSVLSFLYELRYYFFHFGDDILFKAIFIAFIIGWEGKANEIVTSFSKFTELAWDSYSGAFNSFLREVKPKKKEPSKKPKTKSAQQLSTLYCFADIVALCYIERVECGEALLNIIDEIFKQKSTFRETLLYDLSKWSLASRTNRDRITRMKNNSLSQIYFGSNNIIITTPLTKNKIKFVFRSMINNISMTFSSSFGEDKQRLEFGQSLSESKNKEDWMAYKTSKILTKEDSQKLSSPKRKSTFDSSSISFYNKKYKDNSEKEKENEEKIMNANLVFSQIANLTSQSIQSFTKVKPSTELFLSISLIDCIRPYFTNYCGVLYLPNENNLKAEDVYFYDGQVSAKYIGFLNRLGELVDISKIENSLYKVTKKDCRFIIQYTNSLHQTIFHVSNLITNTKIKKELLVSDKIILVWVENPLRDFKEELIESYETDVLIYLLVLPKTLTHYKIEMKFNSKANSTIQKFIEKMWPSEFIINTTSDNWLMQIQMMIIEINMAIKLKCSESEDVNYLNFKERKMKISQLIKSYKN